MLRNFAAWVLAAGLALLGMDRYMDRAAARDGRAERSVESGQVHSSDDGGGLPPPPSMAPAPCDCP